MADRVIHARAAFMSYTSEGPYALVVSGRVFTADPRWRPGDDDQPIPVVVIPLADYQRLAALCQCRPPRAGQDGYTCPRCEDAGAVPYLKASLAAAEARAERAEADARTEAGYVNILADAIDPMIRAIGFVAATASVAEYARGVAAALATVKALTAEVAYLRAREAWLRRYAQAEVDDIEQVHEWLAANPEPQPPEGCEP